MCHVSSIYQYDQENTKTNWFLEKDFLYCLIKTKHQCVSCHSRNIFTFVFQDTWVYKHTGETLHALLDRELPQFIQTDPKFRECFMGGEESS